MNLQEYDDSPMNPTFSIAIKHLDWINDDGSDDPEDLCLHGDVAVRIGGELLEDSCTVSAAALYHLRTLTQDHTPAPLSNDGLLLPCCGHAMFAGREDEDVLIIACPNGTDWTVRHTQDGVELITEHGSKAIVPLEEYREAVLSFADQVMAYYLQCQPKILPEEGYERDGYLAFWREWARRRGIALEDTPIGSMKKPHSLARGVAEGRGELASYPRIAVIGCPGSGKSTLARQIAEKTGHPLFPLDYHFWQPGWVPVPKEEFLAKQREWIQNERWIIDGNYDGTLELRFAAADLVILLDLPRWLCLWRITKRRGTQRPDMREGVIEPGIFTRNFAEFAGFVWEYRRTKRPKVLALHEKYPGVKFVRLRTRKGVKRLVRGGVPDVPGP